MIKQKYLLKSDSSYLLISNSPAYKPTGGQYIFTGADGVTTYTGTARENETSRVLSLAKSISFDFSYDRQKLKQLGYQNNSAHYEAYAPDVNLSVEYNLTPYLNNELLIGFNGSGLSNKACMLGFKDQSYNLYLMNRNSDDGKSANSQMTGLPYNTRDYTDYQILSFGSCYLTNYSLSFNQNSPATVSTKFVGSILLADYIDERKRPFVNRPAINPNNGDLDRYETFWYVFTDVTGKNITGDIEGRNDLNPPSVSSNNASFSIKLPSQYSNNAQTTQNPLVSFKSLILQSFDLNLNFDRTSLYGMGSEYALSRKLKLPINGEIKIQSLVSGFGLNYFNSTFNNLGRADPVYSESYTYDIDLSFWNHKNSVTGFYNFKNARLTSLSYAAQVNDAYMMNASFSVEITEQTGFSMNRKQK